MSISGRRSLRNGAKQTTLDSKSCTVCSRGERAGDVGHEVGDLTIFDQSLQQGTATVLLEELLLCLFRCRVRSRCQILQEAYNALRARWAWKNCVHGDLRPLGLLCHAARDGKLRSLGHAIMHHLARGHDG